MNSLSRLPRISGSTTGRFFATAGRDDDPTSPRCEGLYRPDSTEHAEGNPDRPRACRLRAPGHRMARPVAFGPRGCLRRIRGGRLPDSAHRLTDDSSGEVLIRLAPDRPSDA